VVQCESNQWKKRIELFLSVTTINNVLFYMQFVQRRFVFIGKKIDQVRKEEEEGREEKKK
jgi:hypothetical protein